MNVLPRLELQPLRFGSHPGPAGEQVERGEQFTEKKHFRLDDERPRQRDTLPLPARELGGQAVQSRQGPSARAGRRSCAAQLATPRARSPKATLSITDICGSSA